MKIKQLKRSYKHIQQIPYQESYNNNYLWMLTSQFQKIDELMKQAANIIKEFNSTPDEVIFSQGETSNQNSLYFIEKGKCEVYLEKNSKIQSIKILSKGDYFGSFGFFTGNQRLCSVRSKDFCTLLCINRQDFLDLCKQHLQDYEKFCFIKDKLQFEKEFQLVDEVCYSCKEKNHLFQECPKKYLNNKTDYIKFLLKENKDIQTARVFLKRNQFKTLSALNQFNKIANGQNSYQYTKGKELMQYMNDHYLNELQNMYESDSNISEFEETDYFSKSRANSNAQYPHKIGSQSQFSKRDSQQSKGQKDSINEEIKLIDSFNLESVEDLNSSFKINHGPQNQKKSLKNEQISKLMKIMSSESINDPKQRYSQTHELISNQINNSNDQPQKNLISEQIIQNRKLNLVQQFSESKFFKGIFQQSIEKSIEKGIQKFITRQKLLPAPPDSIDEQQITKDEPFAKKQLFDNEKKIKIQNIKGRLKGANKMMSQVQKVMKISALLNKKTDKQKKKEENDEKQSYISQRSNLIPSNQLTFYLLQQKNIYEQSQSYELLQMEFEHQNKYKMYYPLGNFDIVINNYNLQNYEKNIENEKNKLQNDQKKINKLERKLYQRPKQHRDSISNNPDSQEILSLFNYHRDMKFQNKLTYKAQAEVQDLQQTQVNQDNRDDDTIMMSTSKRDKLNHSTLFQDQSPLSSFNQNFLPLNSSQKQDVIISMKEKQFTFNLPEIKDEEENITIKFHKSPSMLDASFSINPINNPLTFEKNYFFE